MNRSIAILVTGFFLYFFLQIIFMRNVVLFDVAFCFVYIAFLLLLPVETTVMYLLFIAFAMGFMVDVFYDSLGVHAASSVFFIYIRNTWLKMLTPQGGYDPGVRPAISLNGLSWFLVYSVPLIFLHHTLLFFIEAGGMHMFGFTMLKVISSVILTSIIIVLIQYIFPVRNRV